MDSSTFRKVIPRLQIAVVIIGVLLLLSGGVGVYGGYRLLSTGTRVEGTIERATYIQGGGDGYSSWQSAEYAIVATYQNTTGEIFYVKGYVGPDPLPVVGGKINIIVSQKYPELSTVYDSWHYWRERVGYLFFGLFLLKFVYYFQKKKKD